MKTKTKTRHKSDHINTKPDSIPGEATGANGAGNGGPGALALVPGVEEATLKTMSLDELAEGINSRLPAIESAITGARMQAELAFKVAVETGCYLNEARRKAKKGTWLAWVSEHCPGLSQATAYRYVRLAKKLSGLSHVIRGKRGMTLRQAYLATGILPDEPAKKKGRVAGETGSVAIDVTSEVHRVEAGPCGAVESVPVSPASTPPLSAASAIGEGDPFLLADGTELPFDQWAPGLLPEDRVRFQLKGIQNMWGHKGEPENLEIAVLAQKLVVRWAAELNRSLSENLAAELVAAVPAEINAVCRGLKETMATCIDEAASRLNNLIRTGPGFPRPQTPVIDRDDQEGAA